ncbi:MAG: hypothetical protein JW750_08415 [Anaerolineaceae bacterium]|nr:hypothetical protein [Anaerolineaceae bacterium]
MRKKEKGEYGRVYVLEQKLEEAGIDPTKIEKIMQGSEQIRSSTPPVKKAAWFHDAMQRMDELLEPETRYAVRENCACCLGGKRQQQSSAISKDYQTLQERVEAANQTPFVFGHSVRQLADGRVEVKFAPDGLDSYRCVCQPKAAEPISITYCYCCGGHVKHHLQNALGHNLACEVVTTPLSTSGQTPCTFRFTLID